MTTRAATFYATRPHTIRFSALALAAFTRWLYHAINLASFLRPAITCYTPAASLVARLLANSRPHRNHPHLKAAPTPKGLVSPVYLNQLRHAIIHFAACRTVKLPRLDQRLASPCNPIHAYTCRCTPSSHFCPLNCITLRSPPPLHH